MIYRKLTTTLQRLANTFPVIAITGPRQSGKTTLAKIYAKALNAEYHELSAVSAGKDDIRQIVFMSSSLIISEQTYPQHRKKKNDFVYPAFCPV